MKYDYKNEGTIKLFVKHYKGHLGLFFLDMLCATLVAAIDLGFPYISRYCMQKLLPDGLFKTFFTIMAVLAGAYIARACFYYVIAYWGHIMGAQIEGDMREEIFEHMETLSFGFFNKNRTGQLMSRVTNDLFEISELTHHGPEDLWISFLTIFGAIGILCTIEWRLALILFAVIPLFAGFTVIMRKRMHKASVGVKARQAQINSTLESGLSGIRTTKAFANEDIEIEKFRRANSGFVASKREYYNTMSVFNGGMEFFLGIMPVIIIAVGGLFIMRDSMDYIDLITFALYVTTFISPVRKIVNFVEQFMNGMAGFHRFLEIMRTDPEITDAPDAENLTDVRGNISVQNMSFAYENDTDVLSDVSLEIPAGTCFAFVGPSGGGKTTFSNLIPRFYDVTSGRILVDGKDIRTLTQKSLRSAIGIVQQDVFLFAGSVYENIAYGRPQASKEEIIEAAKKAEIHDEIMAMPNGYDTYIGERGVMLSGGQKQRIGIARVFLKNPPIIILDEATSALDSVTEIRIQNAFDELAKGRTSIIIAHRLSTVRGADCIAVIEDASIAEMGSHEELMKKNGRYAGLVNAQVL